MAARIQPPELVAELVRTDRLEIAPLRPADAKEMLPVLADAGLYEFIGGQPPTLAELSARYVAMARGRSPDGSQSWLNWIVRIPDAGAIGFVQATVDPEGIAELAWLIGTGWQGRGFATEAASTVIDWLARHEVLAIAAHIHPEHRASEAVASHLGLVPTDEIDDAGERIWRRGLALA